MNNQNNKNIVDKKNIVNLYLKAFKNTQIILNNMNQYNILLIVTLIYCLNTGCTKQQNKLNQVQVSKEFRLPEIPVMITDSVEISNYLALHYWDNYDFTDTTFIQHSGSCEQIFVNFIGLLQKVPTEIEATAVKTMMQKAQTDSIVFYHFMTLTERYFYDPTSPARNDELYIPALEVLVSSKWLDESHKIRPLFQLEMARKNRVGTKAANLNFNLVAGKNKSIYDVNAEFTILIFYNPGCHSCQEIFSKMKNAELLNKMEMNNRLKIIAIHTENDKEEWLKYQANIPHAWINGWDKSQQINKDKKYDLKASPTLYLLDKNKKVILKDAQIEIIIDYLDKSM